MFRTTLYLTLLTLLTQPALARTWNVNPEGTGDAPTIDAALDSAQAGDVVELACGTYVEWALTIPSGVTVRSQTGSPDCVTVDGNQPMGFGSVFACWSVDANTRIEGLTITGGRANDNFMGVSGGGIMIATGSALKVGNCIITGNYARSGGGVSVSSSSPTFVDCEIRENESQFYPAGILVGWGSQLNAIRTSVSDNVNDSDYPDGALLDDSTAWLHCCDLDLARWFLEGVYEVDDEGCDPVGTDVSSWGSVKALFR